MSHDLLLLRLNDRFVVARVFDRDSWEVRAATALGRIKDDSPRSATTSDHRRPSAAAAALYTRRTGREIRKTLRPTAGVQPVQRSGEVVRVHIFIGGLFVAHLPPDGR